MEIISQLEYPLPLLKIQTTKIVIEVSNSIENFLLVENSGSGLLRGRVMSNNHSLTFLQEEFSGNSVKLHYVVNCSEHKPGEIIHSDVVIMSNGGEKIIPVVIKIIQAFITTIENVKLSSLKEFFTYAKKHPTQSRQMFTSQDFMIWLMNIRYEYMDIFDHLKKDPNKERALENFFILNKLKNKPVLSVDENDILLSVNPIPSENIKHSIAIKKTGWGYIEADVISTDPKAWFKLLTTRLSSGDFGDNDVAYIYYEINTHLLEGKISTTSISLSEGIEIGIKVKKKKLLVFSTDKATYEFDDKGILIIENNSGIDLTIDIALKDNSIRFEGKRYFVGSYAEIPFTVKLSALQLAQVTIKKLPVMTTEIIMTTNVNLRAIKKTIPLNLGNPLLV